MSFSVNLIDFDCYSNDFMDLDAESPDTRLNTNKENLESNWPDRQGNLDTSPILDSNEWVGFTTDNGGITKLVSSEEDLISKSNCSSPEIKNKEIINNGETYTSENWKNELTINFDNDNINTDMDNLDEFISNDLIITGDYSNDEDNASSPGSHNKTMAERWSSNDYDTVLRINNSNDKFIHRNIARNDIPETNETSVILTKKGNTDDNTCNSCNERVYVTERLVIDNMLYHRKCFKCAKCRRILSMNSFAANAGRLYCKPHFLEIFRQTGKYDDVDQDQKEISKNLSTDNVETDELPPPQITKNILEKFRLLESTKGTDSLLPRQLSSGQLNTKCYQSINIDKDTLRVNAEKGGDTVDEFPTPGITKNLLSLWNNIENKSINVLDKSTSSVYDSPMKTYKTASQSSNLSRQTSDCIRHDDYIEETFSAPNTAKSLAEKFQGQPPKPIIRTTSNIRSSNVNRNVLIRNSSNYSADVVSSTTPNNDWLQCRNSDPNQGSENQPITRFDLVYDANKRDAEEFPEVGTTSNLVGLFRSMELKQQ